MKIIINLCHLGATTTVPLIPLLVVTSLLSRPLNPSLNTKKTLIVMRQKRSLETPIPTSLSYESMYVVNVISANPPFGGQLRPGRLLGTICQVSR